MVQDSSTKAEFEGFVDFWSQQPSVPTNSPVFDFYGSYLPSSFYSPAPTSYSTDKSCMTSDQSIDYVGSTRVLYSSYSLTVIGIEGFRNILIFSAWSHYIS